MERAGKEKKQFRIMVEMGHTPQFAADFYGTASGDEGGMPGKMPNIPALEMDHAFQPIALPRLHKGEPDANALYDMTSEYSFSDHPEEASYLLRGSVQTTEAELAKHVENMAKHPGVKGVYIDHEIRPIANCNGAPVGNAQNVQSLLKVPFMRRRMMDGHGVKLAIVDTGVNLSYLATQGVNLAFDATLSWSYNPTAVTPGAAPVGHGTMCAFDAALSAPKATLLDIALLHNISPQPGQSIMSSLLSDAIRAFRHLLDIMQNAQRRNQPITLVVSNSWGMFHPSWDFPPGDPRNYSDNPNHPFHLLVRTLERAGADIIFAAGNCGPECPDIRCNNVTTRPIYGVNSSPAVTCVAGCDITGNIMGYSSAGPGHLTTRKPDITGYTHFRGSGVAPLDSGTSAACPVVAGVVAAIRSVRPYNPADSLTRPSAIRNLITSTAIDKGPTGYDFRYGYGIINPAGIMGKLFPATASWNGGSNPPDHSLPATPQPTMGGNWCRKCFGKRCTKWVFNPKTWKFVCQHWEPICWWHPCGMEEIPNPCQIDPLSCLPSICELYPPACRGLLERTIAKLPPEILKQVIKEFGVPGPQMQPLEYAGDAEGLATSMEEEEFAEPGGMGEFDQASMAHAMHAWMQQMSGKKGKFRKKKRCCKE
ncbi:MAG: S8/S53 family peptidase [Magnetococcus sp. YQC-3]